MQLKAKNISFGYKSNKVLQNVDFFVNSNEVVGMVAPSGYGKTTLAKILSGYEKNYSGNVSIDNKNINNKGYNPVQLIFQHPEKAVNPRWKMDKILKEAGEYDKDLFVEMGIKKEWLNRWPSELSGGELQRFCVLRALNKSTKFLIADEITTMLDSITQAQIWRVMLEYCKKHDIGVIVISHEKHLIDKICDRVINLENINMTETEYLGDLEMNF